MLPYFGFNFRLYCLSIVATVSLLSPRFSHSQETGSRPMTQVPAEAVIGSIKSPPGKPPVESELAVTTMIPMGDYRMFSATVRCNAWTAGVEYDRHSWGRLLRAQFDYVAEVIPVLILSEPAKSDFWGNPRSPNQQLVPGVSISPFGFRTLWRGNRAIRPYVIGKFGTAVFTQKALSLNASYANFNVQADFGILFKMTDRIDLRVDPFVFFHVSNGYLAQSNPGMDELATKIGISYHLGKREH
jgi:hypothetical protein